MSLNTIGSIVNEEWMRTAVMRKNIELDYYQIMPNHFHCIIFIKGGETSNNKPSNKIDNNLSDIIRGFKGSCTNRIHQAGFKSFAWQGRFYDHIIRDEKDLMRIRNYIKNNPAKWELEKRFRKK